MVACKTVGEYKRNQEKIKKILFRRNQAKEDVGAHSISGQIEHQLYSRQSEKSEDQKSKGAANDQKDIRDTKERNHLGEKGNISQMIQNSEKVTRRGIQPRLETGSVTK